MNCLYFIYLISRSKIALFVNCTAYVEVDLMSVLALQCITVNLHLSLFFAFVVEFVCLLYRMWKTLSVKTHCSRNKSTLWKKPRYVM